MRTLTEMLATVVRQHAGRMAVVEDRIAVSYRELDDRMACFAEQLHHRGIRPGDRVALFLPNGLEFVTSFFAVVRLGGIVVPLNDHYQQTELDRILNETAVSFVITSRRFAGLFDQILQACVRPCGISFVEDRPSESRSIRPDDLMPEVSVDSPVMHQFSSGSTGRPKRISRSHRNLLFELDSLVQTLALNPEDRFLGVTPFSHVNGLMRSMMASLRAGAALYPMAKFDRAAVAEMIEKERISVFIGVPFMFGVLAKSNFVRPPDFSSLRLCLSASAPMPLKLNRQFHEKFGVHVRQLYGSTETGTISVDTGAGVEESLDSVGKPIAGVEVEVYADNGRPAQVGETGEVAVKSPAAIERYDAEEELNRGVFSDGFFLTGDLGWQDPEGRLYLVGRKKLFINKGGYKINPREIEELLESHPKVEEAVVMGVPTLFGDERVKAIIVLNAPCSAQDILEHCRGQIADFKVPSMIEFRERLPKTPTGKIRRDLLLQEDAALS